MKNYILVAVCAALSACTSVNVRPVDPNLAMSLVCIQENPKVQVDDFVSVLREGLTRHGVETVVFSNEKPKQCEYVMTYTALRTWDIVPYLSHAELAIENNGKTIASAEYHLIGKGGFSLAKWQGTKTKIDPVIDELFKK